MTITREILLKRLADVTANMAEQKRISTEANVMYHTLNGAKQDLEHLLKEIEAPEPGAGPALVTRTDLTMDAEVTHGGNSAKEGS